MIDYDDNLRVLCKLKGSVVPRAAIQALPGTVLIVLICIIKDIEPEAHENFGIGENFTGSSSMWNAMTSVIGILIAFRIRQALGRFWEGTSLLHQMRGEWFDAASCLITFSRQAKVHNGMDKQVDVFRDTFVRLMSLMHGSALDEISGSKQDAFEVIDLPGLDTKTLMYLRECQKRNNFSKVEALQHLIQVLVTENHHCGILTIPAPILTRVFQTLSRGFVNLLNARKIKDTLFPLPFVQIIKALLLVHSFFTPVIMSELTTAKVWGAFFTFVPLFGLHALNITAWELEMPFGSDDNDLPLTLFQEEMNDTLLMLIDEGTDHLPSLSSYAEKNLSRNSFLMSGEVTGSSNSRALERNSFFGERTSCDFDQGAPKAKTLPKSFSAKSTTQSFMDPNFFTTRTEHSTQDCGQDTPRSCCSAAPIEATPLRNYEIGKTVTSCVEGSTWRSLDPFDRESSDWSSNSHAKPQFTSLLHVAADLQVCRNVTLQNLERQVIALHESLHEETLKQPAFMNKPGANMSAPRKNGKTVGATTPKLVLASRMPGSPLASTMMHGDANSLSSACDDVVDRKLVTPHLFPREGMDAAFSLELVASSSL